MVRGLDHLVVAVRDLDAAAAAYQALGFTVTPENNHPWGTANRLIQLNGFFVELLTVAKPVLIPETSGDAFSFGAFNQTFLKEREGASMLVLESRDPARDRLDYEAHGLNLFAPFSFGRTAHLPDGSTADVGFDLTFVADPLAPGIGFFTCRNRFPQNFWRAAFQAHANGAAEVGTIYLIAQDPSDHHEFLGAFTGQRDMRATSLGLEVKTARGRICVLTPSAYRSLLGVEAAECVSGSLPQVAALEIGCRNRTARDIVAGKDLFGLTLVLSPAQG